VAFPHPLTRSSGNLLFYVFLIAISFIIELVVFIEFVVIFSHFEFVVLLLWIWLGGALILIVRFLRHDNKPPGQSVRKNAARGMEIAGLLFMFLMIVATALFAARAVR